MQGFVTINVLLQDGWSKDAILTIGVFTCIIGVGIWLSRYLEDRDALCFRRLCILFAQLLILFGVLLLGLPNTSPPAILKCLSGMALGGVIWIIWRRIPSDSTSISPAP
jgi:hypothetical protein